MAVEKPRSNLRFALMPTLTAGIGLLVLLAVGAVMVVHWIVDRDVVQDFATALVMRVLSAEEAAAAAAPRCGGPSGRFHRRRRQRRPLQAGRSGVREFCRRFIRRRAPGRCAGGGRCRRKRVAGGSSALGGGRSGGSHQHSRRQPVGPIRKLRSRPQGAVLGTAGLPQSARRNVLELLRTDLERRELSGFRDNRDFNSRAFQICEGT